MLGGENQTHDYTLRGTRGPGHGMIRAGNRVGSELAVLTAALETRPAH